MNANGLGGGIDGLLSAGVGGDAAGLFGLMLGGEGMRDPSKGIANMLDAGLVSDGDDLDNDGEPDHLVETRHKIDDYLAKQWLLGKRKLTVSVNYGNMPLEYQYLNQYHGFPNPLAGTPLGPRFGLPGTCPLNISISTSIMDSLTPSQELLSDQDLDLQDQLHCLPVLWLLCTDPLLVLQDLGLHLTGMVHLRPLLINVPLHIINPILNRSLITFLILSRSLITFLILSQSLITEYTRPIM